jgi:histidinol dehydrogenase
VSPGAAAPVRALSALDPAERAALTRRADRRDPAVSARVERILRDVRERGDAALFDLAREFDGVTLERLEVPRERWAEALGRLDPPTVRAIERAAANLETAHRAQLPGAIESETEPGVIVGRCPQAIERAGVYAPGGRASYPSSVLMGVVPARVAGVSEVIVCSPPGPGGRPGDALLAAAHLARADRVFAIGGAGAIAAMAFGTASVPRVDRVTGPGNAYVADAKLQLAGVTGMDTPAGPSELLVIADDSADPEAVALELVAQAEHDPRAVAIAIGIGDDVAAALAAALEPALDRAVRRNIVNAAWTAHGGVFSSATLDQAIEFANAFAPEHLMLAIADSGGALTRVRNAGAVFLGLTSSVAFGDYMTGGNHVLPTGGLARAWSGLSVLDFMRWTSWQSVTREAAARLAGDVAQFAETEGLPGHAAAARAAGGAG